MNIRIVAPFALLALAACQSEEPSVAEKFNQLNDRLQEKARAYEAQAENLVSQEERLRDAEADALQRQREKEMGNEAEPPAAAAPAPVNAQ
ncbi:hypothetical protein [Allosphingosinicella sp.]|jgi:sensor histidine kinase YesM|uniref:hypothetical protein n=1 Tax=Allosphingosinicella sp. TaxID=2823234 RepID=UPI002EE4F6D1